MKKKIMIATLTLCMALSAFVGCASASKSADKMSVRTANTEAAAKAAYAEETVAAIDEYVSNGGEMMDSSAGAEYDYDMEGSADGFYKNDTDIAVDVDNGGNANAADNKTADAKKDMLVFRSTIRIDTTEFDASVQQLKAKINEYHGFLENEYQTDGSDYYGPYVLEESKKDYTYTATIRIPSEYYESFVNSTEGLGYLRSKNSSVDNVSTQYGTLKNELEIYEAEYARYLEQYENTKDENIALRIQGELRNLAITISDIKTRMSSIESDVAYSYVTLTIHKVTPEEIEVAVEVEEKEDTFKTRVSDAAKESWKSFLGFLEGVLIFFIHTWWSLLIMAIIGLIIFFCIRRSIKKRAKRREAQRLETEAKENARAKELAKIKADAENKAQTQQPQAAKADNNKKDEKSDK